MMLIPLLALFLGQPADEVTLAWKIPTEPVSVCCCQGRGYTGGDRYDRKTTEIYLVAALEQGRIRRLRMLDTICPIGEARLLEGVSVGASLDALLEQLDRGADDEQVVAAIAMHAHPRTIPALLALARSHDHTNVRRSATFWLGQRAGEKAAADLRAIVDDDPDDEVKEHAVFAISQLPRQRAVPMLIDLVRTHRRPAVRERAMFWLAQTGDPRAIDLIAEILGVR